MLIHERFVFLHVPKTGGTFIRHALGQELPSCRALPGMPGSAHWGWDRIPPEAADLPVLAFVRNPWDWYVSWYSFAVNQPSRQFRRRGDTQPLFRRLFVSDGGDMDADVAGGANPANDFATTLRRACTGVVDGDDAEELSRAVRGFDLAEQLEAGHDFYTARVVATLGPGLDSDQLTVGRFESLLADLELFLERAGVALPEGAMSRMRAAEPRGASRRRPYRDCYDDELRELVASSCAALIERFGYDF